MRIRCFGIVPSALLSSALLAACAGGSSATQAAGIVPAGVQRSGVSGSEAVPAHRASSAVRRTLSVPTCSSTGTGAFRGSAGGNGAQGDNPNIAGGEFAFVGAGSGNQACDGWSAVVGGYNNAVSTAAAGAGAASFIGAGESNVITGADVSSAIVAGNSNQIAASASAIVGGNANSVTVDFALIGGGQFNTLNGNGRFGAIAGGFTNSLSAEYGFIGAGTNNNVSGEGGYIAAGGYNTVTGEGAVIDGGFDSTASGAFGTIPGGYVNNAAGTYSFAAGARASAPYTGNFVWSDGSDGDTILTATKAYQFLARASGGYTLYTNAAGTVGAQLAAGSGTWASLSDRRVKTAIVPLDDDAVLAKVATLPISRWSYKSEHGVRHVGPMAQDFYAAFKVGEDDRHITSIDEDGVALAAIKALHAENAALRRTIAAMRAAQSAHDRRVDAELASLEARSR